MTATPAIAQHRGARATISSVVAAGLGTYRRNFWRSAAAAVLFAVVGPLIVIERLRVWPSLKRSASIVWPHMPLVVVTVLLPMALDAQLSSWLEHFRWHEHPWIALPTDVGSTILVGGLVGVLEVTPTHALIADKRRRREN